MLDNISSGKCLPEKSLLVLGEVVDGRRQGKELTSAQAEHQRHNETSWSRYQQRVRAVGDRQAGEGSPR